MNKRGMNASIFEESGQKRGKEKRRRVLFELKAS
jgi:hypothetical protein